MVATVLGEGVRCSQSWSRFAWSVEGPRVTTVTVPAKVARNLTRSFFEIAHKRCNSNGRISKSEICGGELRATLLRLGGHPPQVVTSPPPNGGNCIIRGATRRRHAEGRLLMVQNPHRHRCSERQISFARNSTRSFFEMAHKRCNSNGRISKSEICGGELRATLLRLGGHPPQVVTSPPPNGGNCIIRGATRRRHAEGRLLMPQNPHRHRCGERQISFARNLTRSFFEIAHKRCNSNGRMSQSETCSGELRATLVAGGHD